MTEIWLILSSLVALFPVAAICVALLAISLTLWAIPHLIRLVVVLFVVITVHHWIT